MRRALPYLLCFLLATGVVPGIARSAERVDELSIGVSQFPATLNPLIDTMVAKTYVLAMVRRPLTTYDADWKLVCLLCETLPSFENGLARKTDLPGGKHGVRLTFAIRPNARWGDGVPVTSEDVIFTWQVGRNPQSGVAEGELYRRILKIEAKDAKTFTIELDRLTYDYADFSGLDILPAHIERDAFSDPTQYRFRTRFDTDPTNPGLYDGPYRITEVSPGSHIVFERNPSWWGDPPFFRRIVVWTVENTAALEANLLAGGLDMVAGELGLPLDEALAFAKRHGGEFTVIYKPGLTFEHIDLNLDNPVLGDRRVRQALLYAIDRKAITEEIYNGRDKVADSFVPPLDWMYAPDVPRYPYDPAKAEALLDEAGWRAEGKAIRKNQAGQRLSLELATTSGNRTRELVEEVLQSQWRQIGVDIRLKNQPARVLLGETMAKRQFTMAMFAWTSAPEDLPRGELYSTEIPSASNNYSGENFVGWKNPDADRLMDALETELDRPRRGELWQRFQALYAEELPALPLYFRADAFILPKWLKGLVPTGNEYPSTLGVENWRAEGRAAQASAR